MIAQLPIAAVVSALTASDPSATDAARLDALGALMTGDLDRPVPAPRWRAMHGEINAELGRRAALEHRSPAAILHDEIAAAIVLASEAARLVAMRAYAEAFSRELRLRAADELLTSLCGHHRADGPVFEAIHPDIPAPDDTERLELEDLWSRVPTLAGLTDAETAALRREINGEPHSPASRKSLSRARARISAIEKII